MGIPERRAREKLALRRAILDAATHLIVTQGYANLSIRKIAERIEHAPSTIYLYFRDKVSILAAICEEVFGELTAQLEVIHQTETDALAGLRGGLLCYINFGLNHPQHYLVVFNTPYPEELDGSPDHHGPMQAGLRCFDSLCRAVRKGMDAGKLQSADVNMVSQAVWTAIHGLTSTLIVMGGDCHFPWAPREDLVQFQVHMLIRGIAIDC